jgi:hypothetical protein
MTPNRDNLLAVWISRVLHPFVVALLTLALLLRGNPLNESVFWLAVIALCLILPLSVALWFMKRRGRNAFERTSRAPLYLVAEISLGVCLLLCVAFNAPIILIACVTTLLVWIPLQWLINSRVTKISIHTAVLSGCLTALLITGQTASVIGVALSVVALALLTWSRITTANHTLPQTLLGIGLATIVVVVVFPIILAL